jgi:hypothetical protein
MNPNIEMPSIYNAHDMLLTEGLSEGKIQKLQHQILKSLTEAKSLKK